MRVAGWARWRVVCDGWGLGRLIQPTGCGFAWPLLLVASASLWFVASAVADIGADRASIDAWLSEGKFDQAAFLCREQLSDPAADTSQRALYTAELVRVLSEQARSADPAEAGPLWREAMDVGDRFTNRHPRHPQSLPVMYQTASVRSDAAEVRLRTDASADRNQLLRDVRDALRRWDTLAERVEVQLRAGGEGRGRPEEALGPNVLRALRDRIRHSQAKTLLVRATLYPPGSADRMLACRQALELLDQIAPNNVGDEWPVTRVTKVRALRLRMDTQGVAREAKRLLDGPPLPRCVTQALFAERLRSAVGAGDWRAAEALLVDRGEDAEVDCPEWAVAQLEALVALAAQSSTPADRSDWNEQAREQLQRINARYAIFWRRVGATALAKSLPTSRGGGTRLLSDLAHARLQQGNVEGAIQALLRSAASAVADGDPQAAWRLRFQAAALQVKAAKYKQAVIALAQLSQSPDAPSESGEAMTERRYSQEQAQLMAIKAAALALRGGTIGVDVYRSHLQSFLDRWPEAADADLVRNWLARVDEAEGKRIATIGRLTQIDASFANLSAIVDTVGQIARELVWLEHPSDAETAAVDAANKWLRALPEGVDASHRAEVWAARLQLIQGEPIVSGELPIVSNSDTSEWPSELQDALRGLRWFVQMTENMEASSPAAQPVLKSRDATLWDDLISGLGHHSDRQKSPSASRRIAQTIERTVTTALDEAADSTDAQKRRWIIARGEALLELGRVDDAKALTEQLVERSREDQRVQELRARVLTSGSHSDQQEALLLWQNLVRRSAKASPPWYRAKYGLAKTHAQLGNHEAARKTIALVEALYPDLGGPQLRQQFQNLKAEL